MLALGATHDPRALHPLATALHEQVAWRYNGVSAAHALGLLGDPRAAEALTPLLQAHDQELRLAAMVALARLGDAQQLSQLLDLLLHTRDNKLRDKLLDAIADFRDPRITDALITLLQIRPFWVQQHVITLLGGRKEGRVIPALTELLHDEDSAVQERAADALHELSEP